MNVTAKAGPQLFTDIQVNYSDGYQLNTRIHLTRCLHSSKTNVQMLNVWPRTRIVIRMQYSRDLYPLTSKVFPFIHLFNALVHS